MSRQREDRKRNQRAATWAPTCRNCGQRGRHYFPASLGEPGFFACKTFSALDASADSPRNEATS